MITTPINLELEQIRAEAQKAAFFYETVNDACPYPFGTVQAVAFKDAFIAARQIMNYGPAKPTP